METELTTAEREVAMLIREGMAARDIATARGVKVNTINTLTARLMRKLGVNTRAAVAVRAERLKRQEIEAQLATEVSASPHKGKARHVKRAEKV